MHPYCFVCAKACDPVETQIMRIACGHTLCSFCVDRLVGLKKPCPFCNDFQRPLRHRDVRPVAMSVVETSVDEDQTQVHFLIQGHLQERNHLFQLTSSNHSELKTSSQRVKNQLATLSRLSAKADRVHQHKKRILSELEEADSRLRKAVDDHDALLTELAAAEQQLRATGRLANITPLKVRLPYLADTPCYVRGVKRAREDDMGCRDQRRPAQRRRLA